MNAINKITSHFGIVDVKQGREELAKLLNGGGKVEITQTITLDDPSCIGSDDGESIEFGGNARLISFKKL